MQKFMTWYLLLLKQAMRKWTFWLQIAFMILLLWMTGRMTLPDSSNHTVLLYNGAGAYGKTLTDALSAQDSIFDFRTVPSAEELEDQVLSGRADCGFEIGEDFENRVKSGNTDGIFDFVSSSLTTKGAIARETVYAVFFRSYSIQLLQDNQKKIFGSDDEKVTDRIMDHYKSYLSGNRIFRVNFETEESNAGNAQGKAGKQPLRGMAAVLVFMALLFARGEDIHTGSGNLWMYMPRREKNFFLLIRYAAVITIPALIGLLAVMLPGTGMSPFAEILLWLFFLVWSCLWIFGFGRLFKNEITYASWMLSLLLLNILICPVFFDIGETVPALGAVGWLLPVGAYLKLSALFL